MVMVLAAHVALTPAGKPVGIPIPVAPVVTRLIVDKLLLIHIVCVPKVADTVLFGVTVTVAEGVVKLVFGHPDKVTDTKFKV